MFLFYQGRLGILAQLLRICQVSDAIVEFAEELLRFGVDLVALAVSQVPPFFIFGLRGFGSKLALSSRWLRGR
jgi:hypothetical protein